MFNIIIKERIWKKINVNFLRASRLTFCRQNRRMRYSR